MASSRGQERVGLSQWQGGDCSELSAEPELGRFVACFTIIMTTGSVV